jgi:hypothetical protein
VRGEARNALLVAASNRLHALSEEVYPWRTIRVGDLGAVADMELERPRFADR